MESDREKLALSLDIRLRWDLINILVCKMADKG